MCDRQEGGTRPPRESAPLYQTVPAPAQILKPAPLPGCFAAAALVSYLPAYLYTDKILVGSAYDWGPTVFALVFIACVEAFAHALRREACKETPLWAMGWLILSLCMWAYGAQAGGLELWQSLAWHGSAVWYTLARCGMLAAGHSGVLSGLDALAGLFVIPWPGMSLRVRAIWQGWQRRRARRGAGAKSKKQVLAALGSAALALALAAWAWGQLAAADANFAALGQALLHRWRWPDWQWPQLVLGKLLLSLPVGAWLFGLVAGSLRREGPPCAASAFWQRLTPRQTLPALTVHWVLGTLCAVYALFFAVQAGGFAAAALPGGVLRLSAPSASRFAVEGFWQLCRVLMLDFVLLAALRFFGPALRQKRSVKMLAALFCGFGIAFALLAAVKLEVYIRLYALTPRRVVSGWSVGVLLFWAVLALLWVLGVKVPFGPARLGVYGFVLAFLLLSAVNVNALVIRADVALYNAGQQNALDAQVLADCGAGTEAWRSYGRGALDLRGQYAQWLVDTGWFLGQSKEEIHDLYWGGQAAAGERTGLSGIPDDGTYTVPLAGERALKFTFRSGSCTAAALTS